MQGCYVLAQSIKDQLIKVRCSYLEVEQINLYKNLGIKKAVSYEATSG